jgi:hypothetical protein
LQYHGNWKNILTLRNGVFDLLMEESNLKGNEISYISGSTHKLDNNLFIRNFIPANSNLMPWEIPAGEASQHPVSSEPWGHVNRIKSIKWRIYGRAGFELLRRKVILSQTG